VSCRWTARLPTLHCLWSYYVSTCVSSSQPQGHRSALAETNKNQDENQHLRMKPSSYTYWSCVLRKPARAHRAGDRARGPRQHKYQSLNRSSRAHRGPSTNSSICRRRLDHVHDRHASAYCRRTSAAAPRQEIHDTDTTLHTKHHHTTLHDTDTTPQTTPHTTNTFARLWTGPNCNPGS